MAATIATTPPSRAYTKTPIWVEIETDEIAPTYAYFEITISDGGPTVGQTLTLSWPGGSITYTVASDISNAGTNWPDQDLGETLTAYTNRIGEFLRHREDVAEVFDVTVENAAGGIIRLTHNVAEAFDLTVTTDTMSNVAVTANDSTAYTLAENLRAYVEVWKDTGTFNTEERLLSLHSPYDVPTASTQIDISAAFAHLSPHLPDESSINPAALSATQVRDIVTASVQKYYLRYADKYGAPAIAESLLRSDDSYFAFLGAQSSDTANDTLTPNLRHAYRRRDGAVFRKPVGQYQPDWLYFFSPSAGAGDLQVTITWSDGTQSTYLPYGADDTAWEAEKIYWIPCGFRQLFLHTVTPSGATDPDAYIVAYDLLLATDAEWEIEASFDVLYDSAWELYLLFDNGVGGMETVWMRGKTAEGFEVSGETFRRPRLSDHTAQRGDLGAFAQEVSPKWEANTGWHDDPFYIEHLRQILLGDTWLIDRENRLFLKAIVEAKTIEEWRRDDETLYNLQISIKAGWIDSAVNI